MDFGAPRRCPNATEALPHKSLRRARTFPVAPPFGSDEPHGYATKTSKPRRVQIPNRIEAPWGARAPYGPPARVDMHLADGLGEEEVDRWVPSASLLHSNGDAMDIAVVDGRIASRARLDERAGARRRRRRCGDVGVAPAPPDDAFRFALTVTGVSTGVRPSRRCCVATEDLARRIRSAVSGYPGLHLERAAEERDG